MTQEQIEQLKKSLGDVKAAIAETETMIEDYNSCKSEVSKKYLAAAIKKQTGELQNSVKTQIAE